MKRPSKLVALEIELTAFHGAVGPAFPASRPQLVENRIHQDLQSMVRLGEGPTRDLRWVVVGGISTDWPRILNVCLGSSAVMPVPALNVC
jgi:hypothetical protein